MKTGFIKMFRDIRLYKGRTILTMAGVLIGIAVVGAVLSSFAILNREMNRNFMATNPASMVFYIKNPDEKAVKLVQETYPNLDLELRKTILARINNGNGTFGTIYLRAIADFNKLKVDTFTLEKGRFPVKDAELALERDCFKILTSLDKNHFEGTHLSIQLPGGTEKEIRLSGIVHAPGLAPASMENFSYGFLTLEALRSLGYRGWYDEMRIVSHDNRFNREMMRNTALKIKKALLGNGYRVGQVDVPEPGRHPHADQLNSLLFLLQAFTAISLLAAGIIIINLLNFIMSKQTKQIAIMKTVGASTSEIAFPYFIYVLIISMGGLLLSIPLSTAAGAGYSDFAAYTLNFKIASYAIPDWVFIAQALTAILIPLAAAAYPIYKCCLKSVRDGLSETNVLVMKDNQSAFLKKIILGANNKILMPVNNLIRKKSRTILAIFALAMGGILFMASQNIVASIERTVAENMKIFRWDYEIKLAGNYPKRRLNVVLSGIGGLDRSEIWRVDTMHLKKPNGAAAGNYSVKIMPEGTRMVNFSTAEMQRYQRPIMVTKVVAADEKWLKPGMRTGIEIGGQSAAITLAGIVNEIPAMPIAYMGHNTYQKCFGGGRRDPAQQMIVAHAKTRDIAAQRRIKKVIETKFKAAGIAIAENVNIYILRKAFVDHLRIIVTFLAVMAMLAVIVGGLSIASAIGINVAERKREIGVLRAVGLNSPQIIAMVSFEVILMGLAGWFVGVILSYPVSIVVGNYFGQIFLHANLQNTLSVPGIVRWLVISVCISLLAGLFPAWKVATSQLPEMLTYE